MQGEGRDFGMGKTYTCSQVERKQALVRDDLNIQERERMTDGRRLKLIIPPVGNFMTSWGTGKKELKSTAKRLGLLKRRDAISFSEEGVELHQHALDVVCAWQQKVEGAHR